MFISSDVDDEMCREVDQVEEVHKV